MSRLALSGVALSAAVVLLGLAAPLPHRDWIVAVGAFASPLPLALLGAQRSGRLHGGVAAVLVGLAVVLAGGAVALLLVRGATDASWVGGLPSGAAILLYGVCALPLIVVAPVYALTFHGAALDPQSLDDLRRSTVDAAPRSD